MSDVEKKETAEQRAEETPDSVGSRPEERPDGQAPAERHGQGADEAGVVSDWQQRLELHNAPSWDKAPPDATHRYMDPLGVWYWAFADGVVLEESEKGCGWKVFGEGADWCEAQKPKGGEVISVAIVKDPAFWTVSLEARPGCTVELSGKATTPDPASAAPEKTTASPGELKRLREDLIRSRKELLAVVALCKTALGKLESDEHAMEPYGANEVRALLELYGRYQQ